MTTHLEYILFLVLLGSDFLYELLQSVHAFCNQNISLSICAASYMYARFVNDDIIQEQ